MKNFFIFIFISFIFFFKVNSQVLNETFEGIIPNSWTVINNDGGSVPAILTTEIDGTTEFVNFFGCADDYLITPALQPNGANNQLTYQAACAYSFYSIDYQVLLSTTGTNTADFSVVLENITGFNADTWLAGESTIDLSAYEGQKIYIAFYSDNGGYDNWGFDNISGIPFWQANIDAGISALSSPLEEVNTGLHDIIVNLQNFGSSDLNSVDIEWKIDGVAQTTYNWTGTLSQGSTTEVTLQTDYSFDGYIPIVVNTTNPNSSTDPNNENDTLFAEIIGIPTNYIYEGFENNFLPQGWQMQNIQGLNWEHTNIGSYTGDYCVKIGEEQNCESILVTQLSSFDQNEFLRFYALKTSLSYMDSIFIEYSTDGIIFNTVKCFGLTDNYEKYIVDLSDIPAGDYYIGIRGKTDNWGNIYLDELLLPTYWTPLNDAGIQAISSPSSIIEPGASNVDVVIKNYGSNEITSVDIEWSVNGVPQTTYNWTGSLPSGYTTSVTIASDYNFSWQSKEYDIQANTNIPNEQTDPNTDNDETVLYFFTIVDEQLFVDFEEPTWPQGWTTNVSDDWDWHITENNSYEGDSSVYFFSDVPFMNQMLISPLIDITSGDFLTFYGNTSWPENSPTIKIMYSDNPDTGWQTLTGSEYTFSDVWTKYEIDLTEISGQNYIAFAVSCNSMAAVYIDYIIGPLFTWGNVKTNLNSEYYFYPNPATDYLCVNIKNSEKYQIEIIDITGNIVKRENLVGNKSNINISDLVNGIYILNIISDCKTEQFKFIKN
ncbi:MAG: choice-of-anchor J domain-containing protein [Bacteroidales bacterium]|nr:choice-of-anchor J domain-containing protein [Bacteroidales bacterium]